MAGKTRKGYAGKALRQAKKIISCLCLLAKKIFSCLWLPASCMFVRLDVVSIPDDDPLDVVSLPDDVLSEHNQDEASKQEEAKETGQRRVFTDGFRQTLGNLIYLEDTKDDVSLSWPLLSLMHLEDTKDDASPSRPQQTLSSVMQDCQDAPLTTFPQAQFFRDANNDNSTVLVICDRADNVLRACPPTGINRELNIDFQVYEIKEGGETSIDHEAMKYTQPFLVDQVAELAMIPTPPGGELERHEALTMLMPVLVMRIFPADSTGTVPLWINEPSFSSFLSQVAQLPTLLGSEPHGQYQVGQLLAANSGIAISHFISVLCGWQPSDLNTFAGAFDSLLPQLYQVPNQVEGSILCGALTETYYLVHSDGANIFSFISRTFEVIGFNLECSMLMGYLESDMELSYYEAHLLLVCKIQIIVNDGEFKFIHSLLTCELLAPRDGVLFYTALYDAPSVFDSNALSQPYRIAPPSANVPSSLFYNSSRADAKAILVCSVSLNVGLDLLSRVVEHEDFRLGQVCQHDRALIELDENVILDRDDSIIEFDPRVRYVDSSDRISVTATFENGAIRVFDSNVLSECYRIAPYASVPSSPLIYSPSGADAQALLVFSDGLSVELDVPDGDMEHVDWELKEMCQDDDGVIQDVFYQPINCPGLIEYFDMSSPRSWKAPEPIKDDRVILVGTILIHLSWPDMAQDNEQYFDMSSPSSLKAPEPINDDRVILVGTIRIHLSCQYFDMSSPSSLKAPEPINDDRVILVGTIIIHLSWPGMARDNEQYFDMSSPSLKASEPINDDRVILVGTIIIPLSWPGMARDNEHEEGPLETSKTLQIAKKDEIYGEDGPAKKPLIYGEDELTEKPLILLHRDQREYCEPKADTDSYVMVGSIPIWLGKAVNENKEEIRNSGAPLAGNVDGDKKYTEQRMLLTRAQRENLRFHNVVRKKDYICWERVMGTKLNILEGLELHERIFSAAEQERIVECVYELQYKGRKDELREHTYYEPIKWILGKRRVTIHFGCCYNLIMNNNGIPSSFIQDGYVPIPHLFKTMIKRLVRWHVIPPWCVPDSCAVTIYEPGDSDPPHIDSRDFLRPFCTVSLLSECPMMFGSNIRVRGLGDYHGSSEILLPLGSVLVLNGNGADVAQHCVPSVVNKRISITFWKSSESKKPLDFVPEQDLLGIPPIKFDGKALGTQVYVESSHVPKDPRSESCGHACEHKSSHINDDKKGFVCC